VRSQFDLRIRVRDTLRERIRQVALVTEQEQSGGSVLVIAPHPDDEVLGCGGTILAKAAAGAQIAILVLSRGERSHQQLLAPREMAAIRHEEAIEAGRRLGISGDALTVLEFPDRLLGRHVGALTASIAELIERIRPSEIYVPRLDDGHADHRAAARAAIVAIEHLRYSVALFEYPVWGWLHWPWVPLARPRLRGHMRLLPTFVPVGVQLAKTSTAVVDVRPLLAAKRLALDAHESQVSRLNGLPEWHTLGDIAGGEFLECFFWGYEPFRLTRFTPS
jgi:LmbE family N-acetylglucosaminyl deacetylase